MDSTTDSNPAPRGGNPPSVTIIAVAVVVGVLGLGVAQWRSSTQRRAAPPAPETVAPLADTSEAVIGQALSMVPVDSTEFKHRWLDTIPGLDVSMLTLKQSALLLRVVNSSPCTCGCGYTLATCRVYDTECPVSGPRVEALRDSVLAGQIQPKGLRERPMSVQ